MTRRLQTSYPATRPSHGAGHVLHHGAGEGPGGGDPAAQVVPGGHAWKIIYMVYGVYDEYDVYYNDV